MPQSTVSLPTPPVARIQRTIYTAASCAPNALELLSIGSSVHSQTVRDCAFCTCCNRANSACATGLDPSGAAADSIPAPGVFETSGPRSRQARTVLEVLLARGAAQHLSCEAARVPPILLHRRAGAWSRRGSPAKSQGRQVLRLRSFFLTFDIRISEYHVASRRGLFQGTGLT